MDRRAFFSKAGVGAVGAALAPAAVLAADADERTFDHDPYVDIDPTLAGQYVHDDERIKVRVDLLDLAGGVLLTKLLDCQARSGRLVGYNVLLHENCLFVNTTDSPVDVVRGRGTLPWFPGAAWPILLEGGRIEPWDHATLAWPDGIIVVIHP